MILVRRIIRYSSLSWDEKEWKKQITWVDPDFARYRGSKISEDFVSLPDAIPDEHVMFALSAKKDSSNITIIPLERELEPKKLKMNEGGLVLVGDGFIYYDTRLGDIQS